MRVTLSGAGVAGPGLTTFYSAGEMEPSAVLAFYTALASQIPDDVQITVPNTGDLIDEVTGNITGSWASSGGGIVNGSSSGTFALGQGYRVRWETNGIRNGRHVRGTTFICPVSGTVFDTTGRVSSTAQSAALTASGSLILGMTGGLVVWSRPSPGLNGVAHPVVASTVPETPTALRSRRY